ncbi:hypothetical protein CKY20_07335 [Capnocytophaga canis]|uniref:Glycosyltransferase 2-like domain-containing protein n=1 Tax=Capnocytophaga canis TaxID=1848903 RepID=A0A3A1YF45_9FLAO|nr:glycosyltransferase family 2 protein [Capnocytophaga canis]RIY36295.1 hypothetical protein CKY20_07335 [Capnocytophaga canis]GIM60950.1 hypothetical protein CAPN008_10000 [Capnocytophaga canis]
MLISITIPVYNNIEGLEISLQSIINQTYTNWEVIVVDDGSKENHGQVIDKFNDNRIHFYRLQKNGGRAVARQKTFEMIRGDFCAFLDAGDCYEPDFLENAIEYLSKGDLLGVSQTLKIVYKEMIYLTKYEQEKVIDIKSPYYQKMAFASTIIKADICRGYKFPSFLKYSQDRYFLNYIAKNYEGKIMLLNTNSYIYHQGNDNIKVSTTFKKYKYDSLRLFKEGKYFRAFLRYIQAFIGALLHFFGGYEYLLKKRYGYNMNGNIN